MKHNLGLSHYKQLLTYAELLDDTNVLRTAADKRRHHHIKSAIREMVKTLESKQAKHAVAKL